ncbi:mandelate racemase/muconate lactonizing enzyme family protein [Candidatus Poribacteria bacterium]|nr:mandelate racemase/muconate lactonizing enzyme family protein [Candidatus Poribacteria bacterium]
MNIKQITATSVRIPYAAPVGPYIGRRSAGGQGTLGAAGLIVKIETDAGIIGWGEGTGRFETDPNTVLAEHRVANIEGALAAMEQAGIGRGPMSGVEMALWDALGKHADLPVCQLFGGQVRDEVDFCACMGLKEPAESAATAREYIERWGFRFLKTKAGDDPEHDLRIAEAIQGAVGDEAVLRPDANNGYSPEDAESLLRKMKDLGIRYFEDPCSSQHIEALIRFRTEIGMGILVNMGVGTSDTVLTLLANEGVDIIMPDTPAAGGMMRVKKVAAVAEAYNVPCLMHCSHDLGLKTAAITHIAASTPNFSGPNDTCYHGLTDDVLVEPLKFENGKIRVPSNPGLGVDVDEAKIERYSV